MTGTLRLESLIGREVLSPDGRPVGRLGECRARHDGESWVIEEWVIGPAGLLERLGVYTRRVAGMGPGSGYVVRWDQLDLRDTARPRLTCPVSELHETSL